MEDMSMRIPLSLKLKMFMAERPRMVNFLFRIIGIKRIESLGHKTALKAARSAYLHVPYYHNLFESQDFTDNKISHLTWNEFQLLPQTSKKLSEGVPDTDMLDSRISSPREIAMIGRSSGTLHAPVRWPMSWSSFYLAMASGKTGFDLIDNSKDGPTAAIIMASIDGGDSSGNVPFRTLLYRKIQTRGNFEIFPVGEQTDVVHDWVNWIVHHGYKSCLIYTFPGTLERLLDYEQTLPEDKRIDWGQFTRKQIVLTGQVVDRSLRERYRREMKIDPASLTSEVILYASSDTGGVIARSTPFTCWLERYLDQHEDIAKLLGINSSMRNGALVEFLPPLTMYVDFNQPKGVEDGSEILRKQEVILLIFHGHQL
jgi:phenylacetate-coenzyme A ligase PaaK-like adenylate-forming protein